MNIYTPDRAVVAVYANHEDAETAVKALQHAGLDMKHMSIVAKDFQTEEAVVGFYNTGDRMQFWGGRGAVWGGLWGMLFGGAFLFLPAVGPLIVMGPLVGWLAGTLEGALLGGAAGALGAALVSVGLPKDSVVEYEAAVRAGKFLVLASGPTDEIERARVVLHSAGVARLGMHDDLISARSRARVLALLSDEENARVSTAEGTAWLSIGEEYLDLTQLARGVQRANGAAVSTGSVLPRSAVGDLTWTRILNELAVPVSPPNLVISM